MSHTAPRRHSRRSSDGSRLDRLAACARLRPRLSNRRVLAVAGAVLDAELAAARGEVDSAIALWARAAERQAKLQYDEPPPWYEPVAQRQGFTLLRAGRHAEAEVIFREALDGRPRDGRLLFGLAKSLRAQGRDGDASLVERRLAAAWDSSARALRLDDL